MCFHGSRQNGGFEMPKLTKRSVEALLPMAKDYFVW
ncbi:MAG: hypothetical protein ACJAQW_001681, partial [Paracoccaceae bacterium]